MNVQRKSQSVKVIGIPHLLILGVTIFSSSVLVPAWAETQQTDFTRSQDNQTAETREIQSRLKSNHQNFAALIQEAESLATSSIEQGFAESPSVTEISVSILGERNGQEAPLLFSKVSRSDWQKQPSIKKWTKYFGSSAVLLGFLKPQVQEFTPNPATAIQPSSRPAPYTSIEQSGTPTSDTPIQQMRRPRSSANSIPTRANLEESDPGFR